MSNEVYSAAKKRAVGSPTVKAVLMYMADSASDDGSGIWVSKGNMARDLEMGKRTVQMAIQSLIEMGVVRMQGQRACVNGFTIEYLIDLKALESRPSTRAADAPVTRAGAAPVQEVHGYPCIPCTPTRAGAAPKPSLEPSLEPSIACGRDLLGEEQAPKGDKVGEAFTRFWAVYPKKAGKPAAEKAFRKQVKDGADPAKIITGAQRYALSDAVARGFAKHPQGWLNDQRWNDDDLPPLPAEAPRHAIGSPEDIAARRARLSPQFGEVLR